MLHDHIHSLRLQLIYVLLLLWNNKLLAILVGAPINAPVREGGGAAAALVLQAMACAGQLRHHRCRQHNNKNTYDD
ncbi:hypothetical protein GBA52_029102 [Prunus armeniaca]|nr:hypothetical protein GBA52_029102 [Prunus armeniaca]